MATFKVPRLVGKTNQAGLTSWYWQPSATLRARGHAPQRLGQALGDIAPPEIVAAARALNDQADGGNGAVAAAIRRQRPLTLAEAITRYTEAGSPSVKRPGTAVRASTADAYAAKFRTLKAWGGDVALSSITSARVRVLKDNLMRPLNGHIRHHHAHETLRVGRTLFAWLEQQGLVPKGGNPFTDFGLSAPAPRDAIWWQPAREALFAAATTGEDPDPAMALAIDLAFSIGQREADLIRLQLNAYVEIPKYKVDPDDWQQLAEADATGARTLMGIRVRQSKGKRWIEVPVVGDTRRRVEAQIAAARAAGVTTLLFDARSQRPWTMPNLEAGQTRFIRRFADVRAAAIAAATEAQDHELATEIATLQFRDFRRTAVVFLGELGMADHLIAAITGHDLDDTKRILDTYMPRTSGMATKAIALSRARAPQGDIVRFDKR